VGFEFLRAVLVKSSTGIFWDMTPCRTFRGNISPPFSGFKNKETRALIVTVLMPSSYLAYPSVPTMEAISSSETSVDVLFNKIHICLYFM
jgi:hypothetical protein